MWVVQALAAALLQGLRARARLYRLVRRLRRVGPLGARMPNQRAGSGPPTLVIQRRFGETEAAREGLEDALRQLGCLVQQGREVAALDHEQAQRSLGDDAGGAGAAVEQAHLAEVLAGSQARALARRDLDTGVAVEDQEEIVAGGARAGQDGVGRHLENLADARDPLELLARAALEQADFLQTLDPIVLADAPAEEAPAHGLAAGVVGNRAVEDPTDQFHGSLQLPTVSTREWTEEHQERDRGQNAEHSDDDDDVHDGEAGLAHPSSAGRFPYTARTSVLIPPRTLKSPTTSAHRGRAAATKSSRMRLVTASWNAPSWRYDQR